MGDDGGTSMQFGDGAKIDGEYQLDVLTLAQTEVGRLDEHTRRTQVDGTAEPAATSRDSDVNGGAGAMPGVKSTFQGLQLQKFRLLLLCCAALRSMPVGTLSSRLTQH
jgi:hypothetical protein